MQREHALLRDVLASLTGFRLLQVGEWGLSPELLEHSATLCHWRLVCHPNRLGDVGFDGLNLPVASGSIDALVLAHSVDLTADPHRLLRECERVLNDRGRLVLLGFNPFSAWAVAQRLPWRGTTGFVKDARFYSAHRVCDWLQLLDFEPQRIIRYGVGFPFFKHTVSVPATEGWHGMATVAWLAQAYMVVARKRNVPLTPMRWRDRRAARSASRKIRLANPGVGRVHSRR